MFFVYLALNVVIYLATASESNQDKSVQIAGHGFKDVGRDVKTHLYSKQNHTQNSSYFDKENNLLLVPNQFYENRKRKPKIIKSQKRTVQKIIKKGKNRSRKIYVNPMTRKPTIPTDKSRQMDWAKSVEYMSTTESHRRRKLRKNSKLPRYQMPFHKFSRKDGHRNKRYVERDVYILKDLDEIEFLKKENDYEIVKAHVQKYW